MRNTVALFGEAQRGSLASPVSIQSLEELNHTLGGPTKGSFGICFAIQFLLYHCALIYVRVGEEGWSIKDYLWGTKKLLHKKKDLNLCGVCLPGVSDAYIIDTAFSVCRVHRCVLLTTERDLYDYLTAR